MSRNSPRPRTIIRPQPSVGLVIGTFAAVPYIHLALESRRQNYADVPLLLHDDGSPNRGELEALCQRYGADFMSNGSRSKPALGDLSACLHGLEWAAKRQIHLLVKMSRRFIPLHNWVPDFQQLAFRTQYATYSNRCRHYDFGFRTECVGFHVPSWRRSKALDRIRRTLDGNGGIFVEGFLHDLAREIHKSKCLANREYERLNPRPREANAYGVWDIMTENRTTPKSNILWHNCNPPTDYHRVARALGLSYPIQAFLDANQGFGSC